MVYDKICQDTVAPAVEGVGDAIEEAAAAASDLSAQGAATTAEAENDYAIDAPTTFSPLFYKAKMTTSSSGKYWSGALGALRTNFCSAYGRSTGGSKKFRL